jgi:hypothetical protein
MTNFVARIETWLHMHGTRMNLIMNNKNEQNEQDQDNALIPSSYMSLFPEVMEDHDNELDPLKVQDLANSKKGIGALLIGGYQPFGRPFEKFDTKELKAAFTLEPLPVGLVRPSSSLINNPRKRLRNGERSESAAPALNTSPISIDESSKRMKQTSPQQTHTSSRKSPGPAHTNSRSNSPVAPPKTKSPPPPGDRRSPVPVATQRGGPSPNPTISKKSSKSPPPLPPTAPPTRGQAQFPPLPPRPPLPSSLPPLPTGPPPATSKSSSAADAQDEEEEDYGSDFEQEDETKTNHESAEYIPSSLKSEMIRVVDSLIGIKSWPKAVKAMIRKTRENPSGNPFAIPLKRGETTAVPDNYFDIIDTPMDLKTIRKRLEDDFYVSWDTFSKDVLLVANNATAFNSKGPTVVLAQYFEKCVYKELNKAATSLAKSDLR